MVEFVVKLQKRLSVENMSGHSRHQTKKMLRHHDAHFVTGPAGIIYRMSFSGVWQDQSHRPVKQLSIR